MSISGSPGGERDAPGTICAPRRSTTPLLPAKRSSGSTSTAGPTASSFSTRSSRSPDASRRSILWTSPNRLRLLRLLYDAANAGDQFLISTHSPILLASPGATILRLDDAGISRVAYRDTEQYQLTKDFLDAPEAFFRHLLAEDDA